MEEQYQSELTKIIKKEIKNELHNTYRVSENGFC